jgi:hypothetical protein
VIFINRDFPIADGLLNYGDRASLFTRRGYDRTARNPLGQGIGSRQLTAEQLFA